MKNLHRLAVTVAFALVMSGAPWPMIALAQEETADCATCHPQEAEALSGSVHRAMACDSCHGGRATYELPASELARYRSPADSRPPFEHGETFLGKPDRTAVPDRCGTCHADVERMNPYGLRTDQLARYWTSGHGKALKQRSDRNVAVCTDCHGWHDILPGHEPRSRTHPINIPQTCAQCHGNSSLMEEYGLPVEVVTEYEQSVHGRLLLQQQDTGAPSCATCHDNHSAMPPGFATVDAVCGKCHEHAARQFDTSVHAGLDGFMGCVQCHGGGEDRHHHLIRRITKPAGLMIQRYEHLLTTTPQPTPEQITEAIHPEPKLLLADVLPTCLECHEDPEEDENLPRLFTLLEQIADAERYYVKTARRLDEVGKGVLLVENQRFKFTDAKTQLIELSPVQHALNNDLVAEKVSELRGVCDEVNAELNDLEAGLRLRKRLLIPIWVFALLFSVVLNVKYKRLRRVFVKPPAEA